MGEHSKQEKNCTSALVSYIISCHEGDIFLCLFSYLRWFSANIKCIRTWWRKRNWYLFYILILFSYFLKVVRLADRKMQEYQTPGLQQTPSAFSWEKIRKKDPPPSILGFGWLTFTNIKIDKNLTFSALLELSWPLPRDWSSISLLRLQETAVEEKRDVALSSAGVHSVTKLG